ncbi:winged helix-turn-helix domain-containing protein [Streptomyces sp. NPDC017943]|uniref:winged helix-turn-helix domain-containing protein n=1 Tax=Streptomyces sp. NPDC017943 TaxID=3365019 RepID=UPI0037B3A711
MAYPLAAGEGRSRALGYLAENPGATAREVARAAGISLTTAKDARRRAREAQDGEIRAGEAQPRGEGRPQGEVRAGKAQPLGEGRPQAEVRAGEAPAREKGAGHGPALAERPRAHPPCADVSSAVRRLRADPSLRFTEVGRKLLRTLDPSATQPHDFAAMASSLPIHCAPLIAELARHHAENWRLLADSLTERINSRDTGA